MGNNKQYDETFEYVYDMIRAEGMYYAFHACSDFANIKDSKFHKLRKNFIKSEKKLKDYVNLHVEEENPE